MGRRHKGRVLNGIVLLDKPKHQSSNHALQQVKRLYQARKAGHTGSLDPLATGMLPICFGIATRLSAYLLDADKHYSVQVRLGITTTTGDQEGEPQQIRPTDGIQSADIAAAIQQFQGEILQLPPMYSALKHQGQRLYKLARAGIEVAREPRPITIHAIHLDQVTGADYSMRVHCSKGTYIRTLAEDIGEALGCGAHVIGLHRTGVGPYQTNPMISMPQLEAAAEQGQAALDELLIPADSAILDWPVVMLNADQSYYMQQGQAVQVAQSPLAGWVRLYQEPEHFIGVGEILSDGRVAPRRLA